jgi:hypothetical protein
VRFKENEDAIEQAAWRAAAAQMESWCQLIRSRGLGQGHHSQASMASTARSRLNGGR